MPITPDAVRLQLELDGSLDKVLDEQTRDLTRAWVHAWDEVSGDLAETIEAIVEGYAVGDPVPASAFARSQRLALILGIISASLDRLVEGTTVRITRDLSSVAGAAADAQRQIVAAMLPEGHRLVGRVEASALEAIVRRSTEQITAVRWPLSRSAYEGVRRELIRGVAAGTGPRDVARMMVGRAEGGFNGGLSRALGIARTEILDAHRAAAEYGQNRHADVLTGWVWLAHLTPATCRSCIAMNGTEHPLTEAGPIDHQQGRCSRMPKPKSWAELGIEDPDLPEDDDAGIADAAAWFAALTPREQETILGPRGFAAWKRGDYPMTDWTRRRSTDGWRDSMVPSTAP